MLPVLIAIGPFRLYTFGIFIFLAFFLSLFVMWKRGREVHFDEEDVIGMVLYLFFWGIVGARVVYILAHWQQFNFNILAMVNVFGQPGFEIVGAVLAMVPVYFYKVRKLKWEIWLGLDVLSLGWVIWCAVIALGSFFNGNGAGVPTTSFLGVSFAGMFEKRLPVQLLEFGLLSFLAGWLWHLESTYRTFTWYRGNKSEANSGFITCMTLLIMGMTIVVVESLRPPRFVWLSIRFEILWGLLFILLGFLVLHRRSGWGLPGIIQYILSEWGVTGSLVEKWGKKRKSEEFSRLKLGQDIFD